MQGKNNPRFLITGDINLDLIVKGLKAVPRPGEEVFVPDICLCAGGSAANTAVALARLGEQVSLHGHGGDDYLSQYLYQALHEAGVDTSLLQVVPGARTGLSIAITSQADRSFISYQGSNAAYRPLPPVGEQLATFTHLHLSAFNWEENLKAYFVLLQEARAAGLSTSLDTGWFDFDHLRPGVLELLTLIDLFFPNEAEACALTGRKTWQEALGVLASRVKVAIITRGGQGVAVQSGSKFFCLPAFDVRSVDAVGSGDVFAAGFLNAYSRGWELEKCALWASACGALAATRWGGAAAAPTAAEVKAFLAEREVKLDECIPARNGGYCFSAGR
ncbi:carbohydrate kinase family protein [Moorella sulfitireducens]|uniref:carbohydrate kinase family protein n=1 Tax=Neomoorella sulfitireducens TaxID=2972948 RepID=UPI0021AD36A9